MNYREKAISYKGQMEAQSVIQNQRLFGNPYFEMASCIYCSNKFTLIFFLIASKLFENAIKKTLKKSVILLFKKICKMRPRWLWLSPNYVSNIIGYIYGQITFRYTYVYMLNILASYIMKVTSKGFFLQRPDVILQKK